MSAYVIYLDSKKAQVTKLTPGKREISHVDCHGTGHESVADPAHNKHQDKYFHDVAESVKDASELLVLGPGLAKNHFVAHLEKHHHAGLAKKVVGVEAVDHISENMVLEKARKFFRRHDLFT